MGFFYAVAFSALVAKYPHRFIVFLFLTLCFLESVFNLLFHLGASLYFRAYSPGLLTAFLYAPLVVVGSASALREDLVRRECLMLAIVTAALVHTLDVARNVFFWSPLRGKSKHRPRQLETESQL